MGSIEATLKTLGIELPEPVQPVANYVTAIRMGSYLHTSGHIPAGLSIPGERSHWTGTLGADMGVEEGYRAARATGIALLATLKTFLGDLDRIRRVIKVTGYVRCTPDFTDQPRVINGVSDLLVEVFGDRGRHVRSAVGVSALPKGVPVEIEAVVEMEPSREEVHDV